MAKLFEMLFDINGTKGEMFSLLVTVFIRKILLDVLFKDLHEDGGCHQKKAEPDQVPKARPL